MEDKVALRSQLQQKRARLDPGVRLQWETEICRRLLRMPFWRRMQTAMVYLSFGHELDTRPIVEELLREGKVVTVPKILSEEKRMIAVAIRGDRDLRPGVWGIREPISSCSYPPDDLDVIIVPGLAFSPSLFRLGYGGGYYDRFLPTTTGVKVGLCYQMFVRPVPVCSWDVSVDLLVTEERYYKKGENASLHEV